MNITSNSYEYSLTVGNLDIVVERNPAMLFLAIKNAESELVQQIELTVEQAQALRAHLNSTAVQQIFREGQTEHLGVETGYHKAVRITEPLGVRN